LRASEDDILSTGSVNALAVDDKTVFMSQLDSTSIKSINIADKDAAQKTFLTPATALTTGSNGNLFVVGDKYISVFDSNGSCINRFSISKQIDSISVLDKESLIAADTGSGGLMMVYELSGKNSRTIGLLKTLDKTNESQNRFLNAGKIAVGPESEIYHLSVNSIDPVVQVFSKNGGLLRSFAIEGATVDLQKRRAREFLTSKESTLIGGYAVLRSISVDQSNGHVWIGINGLSEPGTIREESSTLYEYDAKGNKLAEYALEVPATGRKRNLLIDVKDVVVRSSTVYVLDSPGKVYRFNQLQRLARKFPAQ
jgi:outer membrane protein assembly factor BamB